MDFWEIIPTARDYLRHVVDELSLNGIAVHHRTSDIPDQLISKVQSTLSEQGWNYLHIPEQSSDLPAQQLARAYHTNAELSSFLSAEFYDHLAVVNLMNSSADELQKWALFISRFIEAREVEQEGLAILLICAHGEADQWLEHRRWFDHLRKSDIHIWADLHLKKKASTLIEAVTSATAVEVCGWRVDLAKELALSSDTELYDPIQWLTKMSRRYAPVEEVRNLAGREMSCPLLCLSKGNQVELHKRVWRAQLVTIFPWLEEKRHVIMSEYHQHLEVDDYSRSLGLESITELEFGSIARQLRSVVSSDAQQRLHLCKRVRNDIAHRRPAAAEDMKSLLNWSRDDGIRSAL